MRRSRAEDRSTDRHQTFDSPGDHIFLSELADLARHERGLYVRGNLP